MTESIHRHDAQSHHVRDRSDMQVENQASPAPRAPFPLSAVIRRSSVDADMDLGTESEDEQSDGETDADAWGETAEEVAENIVEWLRDNDTGGQSSNYTVAVLSGHTIYISKVNGVTANAALIQRLGEAIQDNAPSLDDNGLSLRLCQKFNPAVGSNHAEMCVLAAIGSARIDQITFFECTEASCDYCRRFCDHHRIINSSPENDTSSQSGWAHPFAPWFFGQQIENNHANQVGQLTTLLAGTAPNRAPLTRAPAGASVEWNPV